MNDRYPIACVLALIAATAAHADTLYALDSGRTLMTLDTATGASTVIGVGDFQDEFSGYGVGLAYEPATGVMYARSFDNLYTIDLTDASTTLIGPSTPFLTGLTFDAGYTTLYSVGQSTGEFDMVDPATGAATFVGSMGVGTPLGLSTRSDGVVFVASIDGSIYTVDPGTGGATLVASNVGGGLTEIAFDADDVLYGVTLGDDMLGTIDLETGAFSPIGPVGFTDIRGLAFVADGGCFADCDGNGVLNILDFVCFQQEWQNQTASGDCDANGVYNILDFVCFQGAFQAGCP